MERKQVIDALFRMRDISKQRKFLQSVDFTINFKGIDFSKPENRIDVDVKLPHPTGKTSSSRVLVFVKDKNFAAQLKEKASRVIMESEIPKLKSKDVEEIIQSYDNILAEGPVMIAVGKYLGQQLAPRGKMPKPVKPSLADFEQISSRMATSVKVTNKKGKFMPLVHISVGNEKNSDEELADNIMAIYSAVLKALDNRKHNIKSVQLKLTMGPPVKIGERPQEKQPSKQKEPEAKEKEGKEAREEKKEGAKEEKKEGEKPAEEKSKEAPKEEPKEPKKGEGK